LTPKKIFGKGIENRRPASLEICGQKAAGRTEF